MQPWQSKAMAMAMARTLRTMIGGNGGAPTGSKRPSSSASSGWLLHLDWVLNRRLTYVAPVLIAIPLGLAVGAVLLIRRRRSGRR